MAAALASSVIGLSNAALASERAGVKGTPQPELKQFVVGHSNGASFITTDGYNGTLIAVWEVATKNADGAIEVCVLQRGARSCEHTTELHTEKNSSMFGVPFVTVEDKGVVYVAMDECCYANDLLFESTNGGESFGSPVSLGTSSGPEIDEVEAFGVNGEPGHIIWTETDAGSTLPVEYATFGGGGTVVTAITDPNDCEAAGIGSYKGGVLAACSDGTDDTIVAFAPAHSTTFSQVGTFSDQDLIGVSGSAILTKETTGNENLELRFFNGTTFGSAGTVPDGGGGGPYWDFLKQDPAGRAFVFTERNQDSYDLEMESTSNGTSWSPRVDMGNAGDSSAFSGAIDNTPSGLVVGTSGPVTLWPVLATQPVTFSLSASKVKVGKAVTATGKGSSPAVGRTVWLQELRAGSWDTVSTTQESSSGDFSFDVPTGTAGSYSFRAEVDLDPGYLQYGYSPARSLDVVTATR